MVHINTQFTGLLVQMKEHSLFVTSPVLIPPPETHGPKAVLWAQTDHTFPLDRHSGHAQIPRSLSHHLHLPVVPPRREALFPEDTSVGSCCGCVHVCVAGATTCLWLSHVAPGVGVTNWWLHLPGDHVPVQLLAFPVHPHHKWFCWLLILAAVGTSGSILVIIFWPIFRDDKKEITFAMLTAIMLAAHVACPWLQDVHCVELEKCCITHSPSFQVYFFQTTVHTGSPIPSPPPSPTNDTSLVISAGTRASCSEQRSKFKARKEEPFGIAKGDAMEMAGPPMVNWLFTGQYFQKCVLLNTGFFTEPRKERTLYDARAHDGTHSGMGVVHDPCVHWRQRKKCRAVPESVSPALVKSGDCRRHRTWYQCVSGSVGAVESHTVILVGKLTVYFTDLAIRIRISKVSFGIERKKRAKPCAPLSSSTPTTAFNRYFRVCFQRLEKPGKASHQKLALVNCSMYSCSSVKGASEHNLSLSSKLTAVKCTKQDGTMNRQHQLTSACCAMVLASTAYTFLAPAWAAKNERIPDPQPTSSTTWDTERTRLNTTGAPANYYL
ncbi:hypothetical protein Z043_116016 [Scleropages formosus]|uniref:Uncharacterized protein n=1 Tax=Scleropages formosus TaxID=113540 RepID=A0A0P7WV77_SCLFO|nr:hypothetical protein Z043_116016 [Scleropages formosus]